MEKRFRYTDINAAVKILNYLHRGQYIHACQLTEGVLYRLSDIIIDKDISSYVKIINKFKSINKYILYVYIMKFKLYVRDWILTYDQDVSKPGKRDHRRSVSTALDMKDEIYYIFDDMLRLFDPDDYKPIEELPEIIALLEMIIQ